LDFAAGAYAQVALDAGVEVDRHGRVAAVGRRPAVLREAGYRDAHAVGPRPEFRRGIVGGRALGLVRNEQLQHHLARGLGALGCSLDLHAGGGRADAACREHTLALDLHHAGAAVAVRPVAGFGRVAQVRDVGAKALRRLPDRLAGADVDLVAVEG